MAPKSRRIPPEEWLRFKQTITELYTREPLKIVKAKMEDVHGFVASVSQYEAQLRLWGVRKNMKREEWEKLFQQPEATGSEVPPIANIRSIAGIVKSNASIRRARRWVRSDCDSQVLDQPVEDLPIHEISVDQPDGVPTASAARGHIHTFEELLWPPDPGSAWFSPDGGPPMPMTLDITGQIATDPPNQSPGDRALIDYRISPFQFDDSGFPASMTPIYELGPTISGSPFRSSSEGFQNISHRAVDDSQHSTLEESDLPLQIVSSRDWFKNSPFAKFEEILRSASFNTNPLALGHQRSDEIAAFSDGVSFRFEADILDILQQCPGHISGLQRELRALCTFMPVKDGVIATNEYLSQTNLARNLLFSMVNGFAGLDVLRIEHVRLFRPHGVMRKLLYRALKQAPRYLRQAVAENIFRAAIEAKDADLVEFLLEHQLVNANETISSSNNRRFTPLAMAARLEAYTIIRILTRFGGNAAKRHPNDDVTYDVFEELIEAAIPRNDLGIRIASTAPSQLRDIVDLLADCRAEASLRDFDLALESFTTSEVAYHLCLTIPQPEHKWFFEVHEGRILDSCALIRVAMLADDIYATQIIRELVTKCERSGCCKCLLRNPNTVEHAAFEAAKRGDYQLVQFLIDHIEFLPGVFCGAVMSNKKEIVELVVSCGAPLNPPACDLNYGKYKQPMWPRRDTFEIIPQLSTPLAEAVRYNNQGLTKHLEKAGALDNLFEGGRFSPLLEAAAQVGDNSLVESLLSRNVQSKNAPRASARALHSAIANGNRSIALTLLNAGAVIMDCPIDVDVLEAALKSRDVDLTYAITETDGCSISADQLLEAVEWGHASIVAQLLPYCSPTYLNSPEPRSLSLLALCKASMKAGDTTLFREFVQRMWVIVPGNIKECFAAAVEFHHTEMIEYLVTIGTCYVDESILAAAVHDSATLQFLLQTIKQKSPIEPCITATALKPLMLDFPRAHGVLDGLVNLGVVNTKAMCRIDEIDEIDKIGQRFDYHTVLGLAIKITSCQHAFNLDAVEFWIQKGCNPNDIVSMDPGEVHINETALLVAISTGREDMVRLLMKYGADINRKPCLGIKRSPLQQAAEEGSLNIAQLLLSSGAEANGDPAIRRGGTALQFAATSGNCNLAAELLMHGARLDALPSRIYGRWPLEGAAEHGRLDMIKFLWDAAEDFIHTAPAGTQNFSKVMDVPGFQNHQCLRAMDFAMQSGYKGCAELISELSKISVYMIKKEDYGPPWLAY